MTQRAMQSPEEMNLSSDLEATGNIPDNLFLPVGQELHAALTFTAQTVLTEDKELTSDNVTVVWA